MASSTPGKTIFVSGSDSFRGSEHRDVEAENITLLENLCKLLKTPDCMKPEVILLIGRNGAGKSAVINTLHKVMTGQFFEIAETGRGTAPHITLDVNWYTNCDVKSYRITDDHRREIMEAVIPKLPHIIDCAGLEDQNTPELREKLELLLGGFIPPGTTAQVFEDIYKSYKKGSLKKVFKKQNPQWKVSKIVFVQGCIDAIPKNLIECLKETLKTYDAINFRRKYPCPVLVLVTKYDLVLNSDDPYLRGKPEKRSISKEALQCLENSLGSELNLTGSFERRRTRWVSLTEDFGYNNAYVDNIALKFLKSVVEPGVPKQPVPAEPVMTTRTRLELFMQHLGNMFLPDINLSKLLIVLAVISIVVSAFYIFISVPI